MNRVVLLINLFILCTIMVIKGKILNDDLIGGNFKHCELNEPLHHIALDSLCDDDGISTQKENTATNFNEESASLFIKHVAMIHIKHHFVVEGHGFRCSMRVNQFVLEMDFFFQKHVDVSSKNVPLSRFDCLKMIESDKCGDLIMNCTNKDDCYYEEPRHSKDDPRWWSITTPTQRVCSYKKTIILAKTNDTKVFKNAKNGCTAFDLECNLENSIIIWNKDIVKECMFESVLYVTDLMLTSEGTSLLYESKKNRFLFKLTGNVEYACGNISFYETLEGLYVVLMSKSEEYFDHIKFPEGNANIKHLQDNDVREFMLAEVDYDKKNMLSTISKVACSSLVNTLRSSIDKQDKFLVINEFGLNDITLYINDGIPYLPTCTNVSMIEVINYTDKCYRDFAVKYKMGGNEMSGFLRPNNILSQFSVIDDCKKNDKNLVIESGHVMIKRKERNVTVEQYDMHLAVQLRIPFLQKGSLNELFKHHQLLVNGSSSLENVEEMISIKEQDDIFYVKGDEPLEYIPVPKANGPTLFFKTVFNFIKNITGKIWNFIVYSIVGIVLAVGLGYCILKSTGYICKNKSRINMRYRKARPESVEMISIP